MSKQQGEFVPFSVSKTPEERTAWVEAQRALGNPKILDKKDWYAKNKVDIKLDNLDKKMDLILLNQSKLLK
tara:strand:- start:38 stop:250 length:213 start_codon:yes stop_codon:yes gene_type:complete